MRDGDDETRRRRGVRITVTVLVAAVLAVYVWTFFANM